MKIAVLGANGMLGYAVTAYLKDQKHQVVALTRADYDMGKEPFSKLEGLLKGVDAVLNCAGVIKPRIAETSTEQVLAVNTLFPKNLAKFCAEKTLPCIHITTDCVYSGAKGKYDENDYFDADDVYGMSKNGGETTECMTLRTSIIGEETGQGRSLLEWARSQAGKDVKGFLNHHWNGVTTLYLAQICEQILKDKLYAKGLFHVHSPQPVNKYELVSLIGEIYDLGLRVQPCDAPTSCDRTMSSVQPLSAKVCTKSLGTQLLEMKDFFARVNG